MRRWQMVAGWVMAVAAASAVGFVAIALVGVGLDPLSGPASSVSGPIGALGDAAATVPPSGQPGAASADQLPAASADPTKRPAARGAGDADDAVGDSAPGASPAPSSVSGSGGQPRSSSAPSSASSTTRSISTSGGSATARCTGERIVLSAWSPAPGYSVDDVKAGPASSVEVTFEGSSRKVEVRAECSKGVPRFETETRSGEGSDDD